MMDALKKMADMNGNLDFLVVDHKFLSDYEKDLGKEKLESLIAEAGSDMAFGMSMLSLYIKLGIEFEDAYNIIFGEGNYKKFIDALKGVVDNELKAKA